MGGSKREGTIADRTAKRIRRRHNYGCSKLVILVPTPAFWIWWNKPRFMQRVDGPVEHDERCIKWVEKKNKMEKESRENWLATSGYWPYKFTTCARSYGYTYGCRHTGARIKADWPPLTHSPVCKIACKSYAPLIVLP